MKTIACFTCKYPVFSVADDDFHQPLRGEMFKLILPKDFVILRGPVTASALCPHCYGFPFLMDGQGQIQQKVLVQIGTRTQEVVELPDVTKVVDKSEKVLQEDKVTCPECGAKAARSGKIQFHKKGCSMTKEAAHAPD